MIKLETVFSFSLLPFTAIRLVHATDKISTCNQFEDRENLGSNPDEITWVRYWKFRLRVVFGHLKYRPQQKEVRISKGIQAKKDNKV